MTKENDSKIKPKLFTKDFICVVITNLLFCTYAQMFMATAPLFAISIGYSETAAGLLTSIFGFSTFLFRPLAGYLVDRGKRKRTVLWGLAIFAVVAMVFPFLKKYNLMLIARFIQGMAISLSVTALGTIAADIIPTERFSEGIGYYGLGVSIMSLLSPGVGLSLIHSFGFKDMFLSLSIVAVVGFLICAVVNYKEQHIISDKPMCLTNFLKVGLKGILSSTFEKTAVFPSFILLMTVFAHSSIVSFLPIYALQNKIEKVEWFFILAACGIIVVRLLLSIYSSKINMHRLVGYSFIAITISVLTVGFIGNKLALIVLPIVYGLGLGVVQPVLISKALANCGFARRGAATATYYTAYDLGFGIGAILWGIVAQNIGYSSVYYFAALFNLAAALIYFAKYGSESNGRS